MTYTSSSQRTAKSPTRHDPVTEALAVLADLAPSAAIERILAAARIVAPQARITVYAESYDAALLAVAREIAKTQETEQ